MYVLSISLFSIKRHLLCEVIWCVDFVAFWEERGRKHKQTRDLPLATRVETMLAVHSTCIPACWHGQRQPVACIDVLDWRGRKLVTDVDDKTLAVEGSDRWRILVAGGSKR